MNRRFLPTGAQRAALSLIKSGAKHILLFGGARSGKTTILVLAIIFRSLRYPGSRHLICRLRLKDARSSVLHETMIPLVVRCTHCSGMHPSLVKQDYWIKAIQTEPS
ncbi:MAG: hypothetical protein PF693_02950 [Spirochaetia bacterium]|nr:hypothetical protein [Spirochaetia bacterium]